MKKPARKSVRPFRLILWIGIVLLLPGVVCGGVIADLRDQVMLKQLSGNGQFVPYERDIVPKDPQFPLEVLSDGYKMVRIYKDMDSYRVEWTWRVILRNRTDRETVVALDYRLQDGDGLLVAASQEPSRPIGPGQTLEVEKTDSLSFEQAKRVKGSTWEIQLLN